MYLSRLEYYVLKEASVRNYPSCKDVLLGEFGKKYLPFLGTFPVVGNVDVTVGGLETVRV